MRIFRCLLPKRRTETPSAPHLRHSPFRRLLPNRNEIFCVLALALTVTTVNRLKAQEPAEGAVSIPAPAAEVFQVAGAAFPNVLVHDDLPLPLVGTGVRRRFRLRMYAMALYCANGSYSARNIIEVDRPAAIRVVLVSHLVTRKLFERAFTHGFHKSTIGKPNQLESEIAMFLSAFAEPFQKNDVFEFVYQPGIGTRVVKNGDVITTVKGAEFKQALLGIWIGEAPVDKALKSQLLAGTNAARPSETHRKLIPVDARQSQTDDQDD